MSKSNELKAYLPNYYVDVTEMQEIMNAEGPELDDLTKETNDILDQFFVDTATWGLERWEKTFGIPTDLSKPIDQRRSVVKSKMRGIGKVDVNMIKNVVDAYTNGDVEVSFTGRITIQFTNIKGIPPNIEDVYLVIEEIKPAHLAINYEFKYNTHSYLKGFTHAQLRAYTHEQLRTVTI